MAGAGAAAQFQPGRLSWPYCYVARGSLRSIRVAAIRRVCSPDEVRDPAPRLFASARSRPSPTVFFPCITVTSVRATICPDSPNPHRDVQTGPTLRPTPLPTKAAPAPSSTLAQSARSEAKANAPSSTVASKRTGQIVARTDVTVMQGKKAVKPAEIARLSQTRAEDRVALNRAHPIRRASPPYRSNPNGPQGPARHVTMWPQDDASWLNWAAQQHRPAPSMRASVPSDTSCNSRMTQRRITDNPAAFQYRPRPQVKSQKKKPDQSRASKVGCVLHRTQHLQNSLQLTACVS